MASNVTDESPILDNIPAIASPLLMGYLINWGLYGILTVQLCEYLPVLYVLFPALLISRTSATDMYYTAFPKDKLWIKLLVYSVYLLDMLQTIMVTWDCFHTFVFGFNDPQRLDNVGLLWLDLCFIDGIVAWLVEGFFAYRLWVMSKSKVLVGLIALTGTAQFAGSIGAGILGRQAGLFSKLRDTCFVASCFWLGGSAICDIIIAGSMTYVLSKTKSSYRETKNLIRRVIILTMETGSFTALIATLDLIIFLIYPNSDFHVTFTLALAKLYANSLLVALNIRMKIPGSRGWKEPNVVLFEDRTVPIQFNSQAFRTDNGHGSESRLERRFGQRSATPTETQIIVTEEVWSDRITNADLGIDDDTKIARVN